MNTKSQIQNLHPPSQLMDGFLHFAKEINEKSKKCNTKFTLEEIAELFNNSFPGRVRATFFLWIMDLNKSIEAINIILLDLNELKKDKNSLIGNPVIRSEFLFQAFFGEFFRIREISKIFIKYLVKEKVLNNNNKKSFVDFYFIAFDWVYKIRNNFIHQGANLKDDNIKLDFSVFDDFSEDEKERFISLLKESNTRENTVEIQCAVYIKLIHSIMNKYIEFQDFFNNTMADLILSYEDLCLNISVSKNSNQ